jgi:hypothetical protein
MCCGIWSFKLGIHLLLCGSGGGLGCSGIDLRGGCRTYRDASLLPRPRDLQRRRGSLGVRGGRSGFGVALGSGGVEPGGGGGSLCSARLRFVRIGGFSV